MSALQPLIDHHAQQVLDIFERVSAAADQR